MVMHTIKNVRILRDEKSSDWLIMLTTMQSIIKMIFCKNECFSSLTNKILAFRAV